LIKVQGPKTYNKKLPYKKAAKSYFKRFIGFAHLWLGLISGVLIIFLGITGCILAFEREIRNVTEPFRFVKKEQRPVLSPSALIPAAEKAMGRPARGIEYGGPEKAVVIAYYDNKENYILSFLNPYTGEVLKVKDMNRDFFRVVLDGHFYLWLPHDIGQPILASATLVFVVMLISGIILWWPRNKAARKQRFRLKFNVSFKRLNYDMHNVLGFYASWVAIFIAVTGLVWGFEWFSKSLYYVTSGGKELPPHVHPVSDTLMEQRAVANPADKLYHDLKTMVLPGESMSIYMPALKTDPIEGAINHKPGTYYNTDYYHYDRYTLKELPATGVYAGSFKDASFADKARRMNYDIHVGAVLGLPGKILAFTVSLVCASLPVTGFLIWRGRRRKKRAVEAATYIKNTPQAVPVIS
jgi:uncharacterized iron-regulated membrane protein